MRRFPAKLLQASPIAAGMPSSEDRTVVARPMTTEFQSAFGQRWSIQSSAYQRSDQPGVGKASELLLVSDIGTTINSGRMMNDSRATA